MERIVDAVARRCSHEPGGWGRFGFYTSGQLFLEEYYTLAVIGKAGIGTPHMDGNTRLCTATAAAALKASFGTRRPARLLHRRRPLRRARALGPQRRRDADRAVDADARPAARARPAAAAVRRPAPDAGRARGRRPPRAPARHQRRARERDPARGARSAAGSTRRTSPSTRSASRRSRAAVEPYTRGSGGARSAASRRATSPPPPSSLGTCRAAALHGAAGLLPVQPGDRRRLRGQQPPPAARHARPARRRRAADERAADGAEHARDGRRRRPAGAAQLGQRGARPRARGALERRRRDDPALGAADARDADLALRRAGLDRAPVDLRHEPGGLAPGPRADRADPPAARSCSSSSRTCSSRRRPRSPTWCCRPRPGGRRRARSRTPTGRCTSPSRRWSRRARRARTWTSSSTTRAGWASATATASPLVKWDDAESAFEAWKACSRGRPCDYSGLTYARLRDARRHPVAVHGGRAGGDGAALHGRALQHRPRATPRASGTTW